MSTTTDVGTISGPGPAWTTGFTNVLRHESRHWLRGRRLWVQLALWTVLLNGMLLAFLWIADQANTTGLQLEEPAVDVADVFPQFIGIALLLSTIGVVVLTQGVMLDERRDGTLEWVLAKPVSRTAMVLAKLTAHVLPILLVVVVVPWSVVHVLLSRANGGTWPVGPFLTVVGLVALVVTFTIAFTQLLGTWTTSRGLVIGVPIAAGMLYDGLHAFVRDLAGYLPFPWELSTLATQAAAGAELTSAVPIVATVVWTVAVVAATAWRFERDEVV